MSDPARLDEVGFACAGLQGPAQSGSIRGELGKVILQSLRFFYIIMIYGICGYNAQGALMGRIDQEALRAGRAPRSVIYAAGRGEH